MKSVIKFKKIKIDATGCHLLINVKINSKKVTLVLDTGASQTVLDFETANSFTKNKAEQLHEASSTGVGGEPLQSHMLTLEKFKIGQVLIRNNLFVLLDLQHVNAQYEKMNKPVIHGVLGGDILNTYHAAINYKKCTLTLTYKKGKK